MPPDLDQTMSTVREALAELLQSAAPLGIIPSSYDATPKQMIAEFYKRDPHGNLDRIYAKIIPNAPPIKLAEAKLLEAQSDLDQAELNLGYCDVVAEIDGVVTRRNVNPGNNVIAGQSLMAIRSLTEIWIDANFKETQLGKLRIGQAVDLDVDMYGSSKLFKGRISGFTMGTGSTLALLPAENATGNFVKVVQRLPVRIELMDYDPEQEPLFIGLSVTPYVHVNEPPTGPECRQSAAPCTRCRRPRRSNPITLPARPHEAPPIADAHSPLSRRSPPRQSGGGRSAPLAAESERSHDAPRRSASPRPRPSINPWLVAVAVVIPTFMEVLDTTIANVALRYIAGGLSAPATDSEWVITSYLAANAIILPISGWLGDAAGPAQLFSAVDRRLHAGLGAVRDGDEPRMC